MSRRLSTAVCVAGPFSESPIRANTCRPPGVGAPAPHSSSPLNALSAGCLTPRLSWRIVAPSSPSSREATMRLKPLSLTVLVIFALPAAAIIAQCDFHEVSRAGGSP